MRICCTVFFLLLNFSLFIHPASAQVADSTKTAPADWFLRDPEQDHLLGVSAEKTYQTLLKDQPSKSVIVAIIDSGIDINHEDLQGIIWTNQREIPGNGVDDDKNGYIDDVHGWNFIGGKNGNVNEDTYELTREYIRLKKKFESANENKIPKKQKADYEQYKKIKTKFLALKDKNTLQFDMYTNLYNRTKRSMDTLKLVLHTDSLTSSLVDQLDATDPALRNAKNFILNVYNNIGMDVSLNEFLSQVKEGVDYFKVIVKYGYNEDFNSREIVGDNYSNPYEKYYGNNDVTGGDALHGTHVAGIIGANRNNNIGIKGIADNVRIMSVRTVPNGDERDKDIANAIRYAVDNGASVINMSFGKSFSPEKEVVDKAVKYAEQKGVLLVHAAGNDSEDNDVAKNFPTRKYLDGKEAKNWIEVGASAWGQDENFVGNFSNYGKKSVDLFAPGVDIYSTTPDNKYQYESGTSMACPATTGVAAILLSYFPELTIFQVKDILEKSTKKFDNLKVLKPGGKNKIEFSQLSITGGLINAYDAVKMAQEIKSTSRPK